MKPKALALLIAIGLCSSLAFAGEPGDNASARHITLHEAVQLALQHNHNIRIAGYKVERKAARQRSCKERILSQHTK